MQGFYKKIFFFAIVMAICPQILFALPRGTISSKSYFCIECHQKETPGVVYDWIESPHARSYVYCLECHGETEKGPGIIEHHGFFVRVVVSPYQCGACHSAQAKEHFESRHHFALRNLQRMKPDDPRYPLIEPYKKDNFKACADCHGSEVQLLEDGTPDPSTWPNRGIGRVNPDGSKGTCTACHERHRFSIDSARRPEACLKCHDGKNYPEGAIYLHSTHGTIYNAIGAEWDLSKPNVYLDVRDFKAPTCATCHVGGVGKGVMPRHDVSTRLWVDLITPFGQYKPVEPEPRRRMKATCLKCHTAPMVERYLKNAERLLNEYVSQVLKPKVKEFQKRLSEVQGPGRKDLLEEFSAFLAESKRYRMNLFMGHHGRMER